MDPALIRAVERFRRAARKNVPTKDIAQSWLDELSAAGFSMVSAEAPDLEGMAQALIDAGYTVEPPAE